MKTLWKAWFAVTVVAATGCALAPEAGGPTGTVFASITLRFLS